VLLGVTSSYSRSAPVQFQPMKSLTDHASWQRLTAHYQTIKDRSISDLFTDHNGRFDHFSIAAPGLFCDYAKNHIDQTTLSLLSELADDCDLSSAIDRLFAGDIVNATEQRAAWHTALRDPAPNTEIQNAQAKMQQLATDIAGQGYTDILHVGIGGSYLGPAVVHDAFSAIQAPQLRCHFITDENEQALQQLLSRLDPTKTLMIVVSKSFSTAETMVNAKRILPWLQASSSDALEKQLFAVTMNDQAAKAFGVAKAHVFPMWDWVGGRFSLWSTVSLSLVLAFGWDLFSALLSGAHAMDQHFRTQSWTQNLPVILALIAIWYRNFFKAQTQAMIPYHAALRNLPGHLQQLHMESLGKRVTQSGAAMDYDTGAVIWGGVGPSSQHSFHQLLLQGNTCVPIDFMVTQEDHLPYINCLAQAAAMMQGDQSLPAHQRISGNVPSTMLVMKTMNANSLGALLAMYEHKIFVQSVIWDIDAFDQWGVESGKRLAKRLLSNDFEDSVDASTMGLLKGVTQ